MSNYIRRTAPDGSRVVIYVDGSVNVDATTYMVGFISEVEPSPGNGGLQVGDRVCRRLGDRAWVRDYVTEAQRG